ncbi:Haloacid dehalogenase-like hydrolase domain-containing 5 [Cryptotermes secundus]|uniref:Haloacid dehalogenase-like hydrolase domain-containing 5 n=1 Tax=Cryptotermes secundus TaxID=105785 RepID=A0A2J7R409_9NEOP|nr:Haloacid dehalogenase-like hydrolase domain-containing 5 [Cryptotermes secundus]
MVALIRNVYRQLKRKHCIVIKYCAEMLRSETRHYCDLMDGKPAFGLLFDIDGVIVRGKKVLPSALASFKRLIDSEGKFRVPTVFVTNAGNVMRHEKAEQLSSWLEIEVDEEQVVMAHSPLRMFQQYHNKCVLISGQGPIVEIAKNIGFKKIITIDQMRNTFPVLDAVDHKRRISVPCTFEQYFPRIEVIILFGEPVRWETALQLLVDTLMTDGVPAHPTPHLVYPHIPLLACNMDLQWMAEARMPRFGHGAFLLCLENLYKKITGHNLIYTALIGKPSEITYHHAHHMVVRHAKNIGIEHCMKRLYAIGADSKWKLWVRVREDRSKVNGKAWTM